MQMTKMKLTHVVARIYQTSGKNEIYKESDEEMKSERSRSN